VICFSYYKSRKDPHPAVRAARGKYSVPTRASSWRTAAGHVAAERAAVEWSSLDRRRRQPAAFGFQLFLFLPPPMDRCGGGAGAGGRRETQRVTEMVRPAGTPARSLPSAPGRCFSSFPLPMAGPGCASRQRTQRTTDFRPHAGALRCRRT